MSEPFFRQPRFDALRNALYHTARRNYLDRLNRILNFSVIVLGAGVAGKVAVHLRFPEIYLELAVIVAAAAQLVFDFGSRARDHEFLQRRYYDLLSEMEKEECPSEENIRVWSSQLFTIAGEEPLIMRALDATAYNNALDAVYDNKDELEMYRQKMKWYHYLFRHFFSFHSTHFHN